MKFCSYPEKSALASAELCFHLYVHFACVPIYIFGLNHKQCASDHMCYHIYEFPGRRHTEQESFEAFSLVFFSIVFTLSGLIHYIYCSTLNFSDNSACPNYSTIYPYCCYYCYYYCYYCCSHCFIYLFHLKVIYLFISIYLFYFLLNSLFVDWYVDLFGQKRLLLRGFLTLRCWELK